MGKRKFDKETESKIVKLYKDGKSSVDISKLYNVSASTICSIVKRYIGDLRKISDVNKKYTYNEKYFEQINTAEKAYWLGFIYADGYIVQNNGCMVFGLCLSEKDKSHLVAFKKALSSNNPIRTYGKYNSSQFGNKDTKTSRIELTGIICKQLQNHGMSFRKSFILSAPNIKEEFISHFIRGYFDGDGCLTRTIKPKKKSYSYDFSILGTKDTLDYIKSWIEKNTNIKIQKYYTNNCKEIFTLRIHGNIQIKNLMDLLYNNSTIKLKRKYFLYQDLCKLYSRLYQK